MATRHIYGLLVFGLLVGAGWAQEKQKTEEKPPTGPEPRPRQQLPKPFTASKLRRKTPRKKNPKKFTTVSVERGKKIYMTQCAMCHGEKGDGKGDMVAEMKINPPDFTKPETLKELTDGELFAIIGSGSEAMPGQGMRMPDEPQVEPCELLSVTFWEAAGKATGKEPEENIILVPQKRIEGRCPTGAPAGGPHWKAPGQRLASFRARLSRTSRSGSQMCSTSDFIFNRKRASVPCFAFFFRHFFQRLRGSRFGVGEVLARIEQLVERKTQGGRKSLQGLERGNGVAVLDA